MINGTLIQQSLPALFKGLVVSIQIAACASTLGLVQGFVITLLQTCKIKPIEIAITLFVNIIRGTPMLIQILFAFYVLPHYGITFDAFWTAVIAIGCNSSAYISQILRSGIQSIPKGQFEAAYVLGLSKMQTMRFVILPQALTIVLPALGNEFITLIKDSSLASIIGVSELSKEGRLIISRTYDAITIFTIIACLYLMVTLTLSFLIHKLEQKMRPHAHH